MTSRKLIWQIYPYYLLVIIVTLIAVAFYASRQITRTYDKKVTDELTTSGMLIGHAVREIIGSQGPDLLQGHCDSLAKLSGARITLIDTNGIVLSDSEQNPSVMENHARRPEIAQALSGLTGESTRYSNTLQQHLKYVAVPITASNKVIGVVRMARPLSEVEKDLTALNRNVIVAGLLLIIIATLVSLYLFRRVSRPLGDLTIAANRMASGDLTRQLPVKGSSEIEALTKAMNNMAKQLDIRLKTIARQNNEQEAILSSMVEGVLAVDADERILSLNEAAAKLLEIQPEQARRRRILEIIRHAELYDFIARSLKSASQSRTEIALSGDRLRHLQIHANVLKDASDSRIGSVLVLNDITRLRMLENMRRDFVANVSHELRTPVTAILGSVETLLSKKPNGNKDTRQLLEIIGRQAERLNTLVADLLTLSKLEHDMEDSLLNKMTTSVAQVVKSAIQSCEPKSRLRNIDVNFEGDESIMVAMDAARIEQALVNLIDNAIKFSDENSTVMVTWQKTGDGLVIEVSDSGPGIEKRHLARLFERFYRVDKARSRDMGGTGLGLAIVKHIALAHKGHVAVESTVGVGSKFRIYIPATT